MRGHWCLRGSNQEHLYSELNLRFYEAFQALAESVLVERSEMLQRSCEVSSGHIRVRSQGCGEQIERFSVLSSEELCSRLIAKLSVNMRTKVDFLGFGVGFFCSFFCFVLISRIPKYFRVWNVLLLDCRSTSWKDCSVIFHFVLLWL